MTTETTCSSWGFPAPMNPDLDFAGKLLLARSGGRPVSARVNGVPYLFSYQDGVIRARPCAAPSTLGDAPPPGSSPRPLLFYLYRKTGGGWSPVGDWVSNADAQDQMTTILTASPTAQLGAYAWDGVGMTWKFF